MVTQLLNSWTFNFVEVSGHNLESSQTFKPEVPVYNVNITNQYQTTFAPGGGDE